MKTFFIAEAGVNHNGQVSTAIDLVNIAAESGASAVKFQMFSASDLVTKSAKKANYQKNNKKESQFDMLKKLELKLEEFELISERAKELGIEFMCSAFDIKSLSKVISLGVKKLKIPSGEITNGPLLIEHGKSGLDIILSTGMSSMEEIKQALNIISYGYQNINEPPKGWEKSLPKYESFKSIIEHKVTLLHCVSSYPVEHSDQNLNSIKLLKDKFGTKVGYSDHSVGTISSVIAVTLGAKVIEKHFTVSKKMQGPDHLTSLEPKELKQLINEIKITEDSLGVASKKIVDSEQDVLLAARKSIVAKQKIEKGDIFSENNLICKRPGNGISPMEWDKIIDSVASKPYEEYELIKE